MIVRVLYQTVGLAGPLSCVIIRSRAENLRNQGYVVAVSAHSSCTQTIDLFRKLVLAGYSNG